VKHVVPVSRRLPSPADKFQEFLANKTEMVFWLVDALGGDIPFLTDLHTVFEQGGKTPPEEGATESQ